MEQLRSLDLFCVEETERIPHCSYNLLMKGRGEQALMSSLCDRTKAMA